MNKNEEMSRNEEIGTEQTGKRVFLNLRGSNCAKFKKRRCELIANESAGARVYIDTFFIFIINIWEREKEERFKQNKQKNVRETVAHDPDKLVHCFT